MSDSSRPHGPQPTRLLRPWDFPRLQEYWSGVPLPSPTDVLVSSISLIFFLILFYLNFIYIFIHLFLFILHWFFFIFPFLLSGEPAMIWEWKEGTGRAIMSPEPVNVLLLLSVLGQNCKRRSLIQTRGKEGKQACPLLQG